MATNNNEFFDALAALEKERGLPADYLIDKIKAAIVIAVKKDYEVEDDNVVVDIDPNIGAFRASLLQDIVEEVENPHTQVSLEDAQKIRKTYKVGQRLVTPLKTKEFGRIAAQTAKHVIRQGLREGERSLQCSEMQSRAHEIITGTVTAVDAERGNIVLDLKKDGIELDHIDFGGGLGVRYGDETPPSAETLVKRMTELTSHKGLGDLTLFFEPGRSLSAEAGLLVMTAQYLKTTPHKRYCITDAGMNDMLRPTLYQAKMTVVNTVTHEGDAATPTDIVGPICESGDWLAKDERIAVREGDILAMTCAGAYGMTMSGNYNARPRAAEVLVDGEKATLIRRRETIVDLMRGESLPEL